MGLSDSEKLLIYFDSEAHLVRRLGAAVVSCWRDLDPAIRALIIVRAKRVLDDETDDQLDDPIDRFLTVHDGAVKRDMSNAS